MRVRPDVVGMRGTKSYLNFLVSQIFGRMGNECMGEHRLRDGMSSLVAAPLANLAVG